LLSFDEACAYLSCTPRWLRRARAERRVSCIKLGALLRFDPIDLDAYLERNREVGLDD
jgi:excisionase family DNA binding protein